MTIDALIEFLLEVLTHNPAELHEHLKNTENKKTELRSTRQLSHLQSSAEKHPFYLICNVDEKHHAPN